MFQKTITVSPGGAAVSVKMPPAQKAQTVITAGGTPVSKPVCVPSSTTHTPAPTQTNRVTVVSQVCRPPSSFVLLLHTGHLCDHLLFFVTMPTGDAGKREEV